MSRQLAISAAFSILMMAAYVLFGAGVVRWPVSPDAAAGPGDVGVQVAAPAPELSAPAGLLPALLR